MIPGIGYAVLTILLGLVAAGIARITIRWLKKKAEITATKLDDIIIAAIGTPVQVTIIIIGVYIALTWYGIIPARYAWLLDQRAVTTFYIIMGAWILASFLHDIISIYGSELAEISENELDGRLIELLKRIVKYIVWFAALMLILSVFQVDITPFLAGAGIAGIALALAAQDLLANFFSGAIITMDKPFKVGDRIRFDNYLGDIVCIGPRSTRLKTLDHQIVTIPNAKITSNIVVNFAMPDIRMKVRVPFSVAYGSEMLHVKKILLEIAREAIERTAWVLSDPAPSVYFLEFGESGLNGQLILWTNNYDNSWDVQDYVNSRIDERFRDEGIEIPFRQVDIRMRQTGGT